jgi:hypothetical protein
MAIVFRSAGALASNATGTPVIAMPAGVVAGDALIMQYVCDSTVTPTTPTGWTKMFGPVAMVGTGYSGHGYWRVAGGSEPGSYTVAHTGANAPAAGIISAYTGADATTPVDVSATTTGEAVTTTGTTPSVTTTHDNELLLRMYVQRTPGTMSITPGGGETERYDTGDATDTNCGFELATSAAAVAGATGSTSATFASNALGYIPATIALQPLGSSGGGGGPVGPRGADRRQRTAKKSVGSVASGVPSSGIPDANTVSPSPGGALGTGDNADRYAPGIEAV